MSVISIWVPIREPADGYVEGEYDVESGYEQADWRANVD